MWGWRGRVIGRPVDKAAAGAASARTGLERGNGGWNALLYFLSNRVPALAAVAALCALAA